MTPEVQAMKGKLSFIKISFHSAKCSVMIMERQATEWENICKIHMAQRTSGGSIQRILKTVKNKIHLESGWKTQTELAIAVKLPE